MTNTIVIEISGQMLQMTLMVPAAAGNPLIRLGRALLGKRDLKKAGTVQLIGAIDASSVGARIGQALEALTRRTTHLLKSCDVRIQLGANFAKVAIIDSPNSEGKVLSAAALHQHLQAWIAWNWGSAIHGIVRHAELENKRLLVSVVAEDMSDALEKVCSANGLRLADCRPAIVSLLESPPKQTVAAGIEVIVFEEVCEDRPSALVQFVARTQHSAMSIHRMWLPEASDESILGVAQRVLVHHAHQGSPRVEQPHGTIPVRRVQWPTSAAGGRNG